MTWYGALGRRPAAQQGDLVAAGRHALGQPVHQDLGPARPGIGEVPPGDEQDVPRGRSLRRAAAASAQARGRQPAAPG